MQQNEKKEIAKRLTTRVSTGLMFVEFEYLARHSTPDLAWIRNIYILMSFYTELLLKAIFVLKGNFADINDLEAKLKKVGHDLCAIGQAMGIENLKEYGISKITRNKYEFIVETSHGNFTVNDFTDIRYDFLDGRIRTLNGDEHEKFKKQIEIMYKINEPLKQIAWGASQSEE